MKRVEVDMIDDGIIWLVNRSVFHPRGYALAVDSTTGKFYLYGDGAEPWVFPGDGSQEVDKLTRIKQILP